MASVRSQMPRRPQCRLSELDRDLPRRAFRCGARCLTAVGGWLPLVRFSTGGMRRRFRLAWRLLRCMATCCAR